MLTRILTTLRATLLMKWEQHLPTVISNSESCASTGMSVQDAYRLGFRSGYWEGAVDATEAFRMSEQPVAPMFTPLDVC